MKKGKFVVIEGLDGSGKKTQFDLLVKHFQKRRIGLETVDFPQYDKTFFGKLVARYLKGGFGSLQRTNPYLISLLYAGDRWQAKKEMKQALSRGKILLTNRYIASSLAFMAGKFLKLSEQKKIIRFIQFLEYRACGCPQEDLLIYLSVPPDICQKLILKRDKRKYLGNKNRYDLHEMSLTYLKRVEKIYLRLVKKYQHWVKIDCLDKKGKLKTREEIHELVLGVLKDRKIVVS